MQLPSRFDKPDVRIHLPWGNLPSKLEFKIISLELITRRLPLASWIELVSQDRNGTLAFKESVTLESARQEQCLFEDDLDVEANRKAWVDDFLALHRATGNLPAKRRLSTDGEYSECYSRDEYE